MPLFRNRFLSWTAVILALFVLVVSIIFNILLGLNKAKFVDAANTLISDRLDVGYMAYIFPNIVVIKDAVLIPNDDLDPALVIKLPTITAEFSFLEFILRQNVVVQKIKLYSPYLHHGYFSDFLKRNGKQLLDFLLQLPRIDFRFSVKEGLWDFTPTPESHGVMSRGERLSGSEFRPPPMEERRNGAREEAEAIPPDYLQLNFVFWIKKDTVWVQGAARKDKYIYNPQQKTRWPRRSHEEFLRGWQRHAVGLPLEFDFKAVWAGEGLFIDQLALTRKNIYLKLWGSLFKEKLQLNGFSFLNTYPNEEYKIVKSAKQSDRIHEYLRKVKKSVPVDHFQGKDLYIMDMDCLARISLPRIDLERLNFNFNDVPVTVKGVLLFNDLFSAEMDIGLDPAQSKNFSMKNLNKIQWHLTGASDGKVFTSDNDIHVSFDKAKNPNFPVAKIDSTLNGLRFLLDQYARPSVRLNRAETTITIGENLHKLFLENAAISLNALKSTLRLLEIKSPFYGGKLAGKFWLTTGQPVPKIDGTVVLNDVDVHQLDELFFDFAKAEGRLFGRIHLTSVPRLNLDGQFDMYNGRLKNFSFFQWLADTFNLPSLQQVDFKQVSSGFTADMDALEFKGILLSSENVNISGDFGIDKNSLVTSYLSLAFSKKLLDESAKFRPILKIFGEDIPMVVFDFQLAGRQEALNFQWMPSPHKSMIQEKIPNFVERIIERRINEMMAPVEAPQEATEQKE